MTKLYRVMADPDTGQWQDEPMYVGTVDLWEFKRREDTKFYHHETFELLGETCAVVVHWRKGGGDHDGISRDYRDAAV